MWLDVGLIQCQGEAERLRPGNGIRRRRPPGAEFADITLNGPGFLLVLVVALSGSLRRGFAGIHGRPELPAACEWFDFQGNGEGAPKFRIREEVIEQGRELFQHGRALFQNTAAIQIEDSPFHIVIERRHGCTLHNRKEILSHRLIIAAKLTADSIRFIEQIDASIIESLTKQKLLEEYISSVAVFQSCHIENLTVGRKHSTAMFQLLLETLQVQIRRTE